MFNMDSCPSCGQKPNKLSMEKKSVDGRIVTLIYCDVCPAAEKKSGDQQEFGFPQIKIKRSRRKKAENAALPGADEKFEKFALSPEQIQSSQAIKPGSNASDSRSARDIASVDKRRLKLYCYTDYMKGRGERERTIAVKSDAEFGYGNWKKIYDNGTKVIVEPIHQAA